MSLEGGFVGINCSLWRTGSVSKMRSGVFIRALLTLMPTKTALQSLSGNVLSNDGASSESKSQECIR